MSEALNSRDWQLQTHFSTGQSKQSSKILIICGETDPIIVKDELKEDSARVFGGSEHLTFKKIDAGHDFPITKSGQVVDLITGFWEQSAL